MATIEYLSPSDLTFADNVRSTAAESLTQAFVQSISERGVLEPILAHRGEDGTVTVLAGHRRTLAAQQAELTSVPVIIQEVEQKRADRIIDQLTENLHRQGLGTSDVTQAIGQLALEGLSVTAIAKQTAMSRKEVKTAVSVAKSPVLVNALHTLTLDQAAELEAFVDDPEAVAKLIEAAEDDYFDHTLSQLRLEKAEKAGRVELTAKLEAAGHRIATEEEAENALDTRRLRTSDGDRIEDHTGCPGHAHIIESRYVWHIDDEDERLDEFELRISDRRVLSLVEVCVDPKGNGHTDGWSSHATSKKSREDMTEEEKEEALVERRRVIANNKGWDAATEVRREWLANFAQAKTAPKGAHKLIAAFLWTLRDYGNYSPLASIYDEKKAEKELATASAGRLTQIALIWHLAKWEANTTRDTWRRPQSADRAVLAALRDWGYKLSDVEAEVADGSA